MLLGEPPPTQADVHFRLLGFPIRVHPFFWIVALILGMGGLGADDRADPILTLLWVVVIFVSIVVHELGHALTQRHFGGHPWITLYALGGLAACDDCDRGTRAQVLISAAGPAAGFSLAGVTVLLLYASGHLVGWQWSLLPVEWELFDPEFMAQAGRPSLRDAIVFMVLAVNIFWGLLNLLPIYPLDGGRISRELFTLSDAHRGIVHSLWVSAGTAAAVGLLGLLRGSIFTLLMFGYLAYQNYQTLQSYRDRWSGRSPW